MDAQGRRRRKGNPVRSKPWALGGFCVFPAGWRAGSPQAARPPAAGRHVCRLHPSTRPALGSGVTGELLGAGRSLYSLRIALLCPSVRLLRCLLPAKRP